MHTAKPALSGPAPSEDDIALVARFRASGDADALGQIFSRHADAAFRVAMRQTGNPADAEEAVQCAFTQFLERGGDAMVVRGSVRSYVIGAVLNNCCNLLRREVTLRQRHQSASGRMDRSGGADLDDGEGRRELEQELKAAIDALPEDLRLPVWMRYFEDLSFAEIATALATKEITLRKRVERGLALLHRHLSARGFACGLAVLPSLFLELPAEEFPGTYPTASIPVKAKARVEPAPTWTAVLGNLPVMAGAAVLLAAGCYGAYHFSVARHEPAAAAPAATAIPETGLIYKDDFASRQLDPFWTVAKGREHIVFPPAGGGMLFAISNLSGTEPIEIELLSTPIPMARWDLHWEIAPSAPVGSGRFSCGIDVMDGDGLYMANRIRVNREQPGGPYRVSQRKIVDDADLAESGQERICQEVPRIVSSGSCVFNPANKSRPAVTIRDTIVNINGTRVEVFRIRLFLLVEPGGAAEWKFRQIAVARDRDSLALPIPRHRLEPAK